MKLNYKQILIISRISAFIGKSFDEANLQKGVFCWHQIVELHFKEKEFFMCVDIETPLFDNRKLYFAIVGLCKEFDLLYGEFDYRDDGSRTYL